MTKILNICAGTVLLLFCGCGNNGPEQDAFLLKGIEFRKEGKNELAEKFLRRHLLKYPESRSGLLEMAALCDESLHKPAAAIYFYDTALELIPADDPDRNDIESFRNQLLEKLNEREKSRTDAEIKRLLAENAALRKLAAGHKDSTEESEPAVKDTSADFIRPPRSYIVKSGDTPGKIARIFYGSAAEYPRILQANGLTEKSMLHIGQRLIIPAIQK